MMTRKTRAWWVERVQDKIRIHTRPTKDPWHGYTESGAVIESLAREVQRYSMAGGGPGKVRKYDENLRMASVLGYVLCLWYARIHKAKAFDPRRPVTHRRAAYMSRQMFLQAMFEAMIDDSRDAEFFPGQKWESPYDPNPTEGYFV